VATTIDREPDWRTADNPDVLLRIVCPPSDPYSTYGWIARNGHLPPQAFRRLQLFGCACARMVWELLSVDARNAVLIRERFAEGRATEADLRASALRLSGPETSPQQHAAACAARAGGHHAGPGPNTPLDWEPPDAARSAAKALATRAAGPAPPGGNPVSKEWQVAWNRAFSEAREYQAELVRDIFPPPGYTPALRPDWRTSTVLALARQMDDTGDFSAVPILADALQDAGCDNEFMLDRCRAPSGVHCRGNWVVDLVLGRE
jgi:hypothetical protein